MKNIHPWLWWPILIGFLWLIIYLTNDKPSPNAEPEPMSSRIENGI